MKWDRVILTRTNSLEQVIKPNGSRIVQSKVYSLIAGKENLQNPGATISSRTIRTYSAM